MRKRGGAAAPREADDDRRRQRRRGNDGAAMTVTAPGGGAAPPAGMPPAVAAALSAAFPNKSMAGIVEIMAGAAREAQEAGGATGRAMSGAAITPPGTARHGNTGRPGVTVMAPGEATPTSAICPQRLPLGGGERPARERAPESSPPWPPR